MPLDLEISNRAVSDVEKIAIYIAKRNRDSMAAERFARGLLDKCTELIAAPGMGSIYLDRADIRKINEGAYKILYRVTAKKVIVLRIWDGRRRKGHELYCSHRQG
jgi:plasmid stabilization system protein ParE